MRKFSFENIHRNKKMAYLDGFLCGITFAYIAKVFWDDYIESQDMKKAAEESLKQKEPTNNLK